MVEEKWRMNGQTFGVATGLELTNFEVFGCDFFFFLIPNSGSSQHVIVKEAGREELNEILNSPFCLFIIVTERL